MKRGLEYYCVRGPALQLAAGIVGRHGFGEGVLTASPLHAVRCTLYYTTAMVRTAIGCGSVMAWPSQQEPPAGRGHHSLVAPSAQEQRRAKIAASNQTSFRMRQAKHLLHARSGLCRSSPVVSSRLLLDLRSHHLQQLTSPPPSLGVRCAASSSLFLQHLHHNSARRQHFLSFSCRFARLHRLIPHQRRAAQQRELRLPTTEPASLSPPVLPTEHTQQLPARQSIPHHGRSPVATQNNTAPAQSLLTIPSRRPHKGTARASIRGGSPTKHSIVSAPGSTHFHATTTISL